MENLNLALLCHTAIGCSIIMFFAWLWQIKTSNAAIVDALWALLISVSSVYLALRGSGEFELRVLLAIIGGVWFARLGSHLLLRVLSEGEDGRYVAMRKYFGKRINLFHFFFFQVQAALVVLCTLPVWYLSHVINISITLKIIALLIVVVAFIGEHQADHQLHLWRSDPDNKGKTCRTGLWKYSRHPNYFFEWCHWFAYPILGLGIGFSSGGGWLWLAPIIMFCFLYWGTGIPYTEKQALKSRGEDYRNYQKTTSAFIPWPPKNI